MPDLTDEEYDALDEYFTKNDIMPDISSPGFFARKYGMTVRLDPETTRIIADRAQAEHTTPAHVIGALAREKIAASA
ncbi:MAG: hypothetical protein LBG72_01425 [Spirochaetaceae bacterium]|jgi:hypothetical protein|nr:hypothetical protein [Spirochaetaceae bacterium]